MKQEYKRPEISVGVLEKKDVLALSEEVDNRYASAKEFRLPIDFNDIL